MKTAKNLCYFLAGALLLSSCSSSSQSIEKNSQELTLLVDEYFESYLKLYPLFATSIGDHRYDDKLTITISQKHKEEQTALIEKSLARLKKINSKYLSEQDLLTYEVFSQDLQTDQKLLKTDLSDLMPFDQLNSFFSDFAELASGSSFITFNTQADYENFLKRAEKVPDFIDTMIENMKEGIHKKITTPQILVSKGLKQLEDLLVPDYKKSLFYKPLLTLDTKVTEPARSSIKQGYESVIQTKIYPSYQKLKQFVAEQYLPKARTTDGLSALPGGKEFYRSLVKYHTTTDLSPEEIQNLGYSEVKRIKAEFETIKSQMNFKGDLSSFYASLKENSPHLYPFHSAEEILNAYQAIYTKVMQNIPHYFHLMPKAPFEIREVEKFKAENASEAYQNASEDGSRPAIFWVPIPDARKYSAKDMEALFLHEAIPGHHFQISIQQELTNLPRYRKFTGNTAYIEGWALYAESLGKDLGMYTDPYQWIGRLTLEMHRAIRLVVDTGIHWDGWSREKAIQYALEQEPADLSTLTSEIDRYMAMPGQALAYKVGELKIQELKKLAQTKLGSKYSDKAFHDEILEEGALPLSVLDAKIERFIKKTEKQSSP